MSSAQTVTKLSCADQRKLGAVVTMAGPSVPAKFVIWQIIWTRSNFALMSALLREYGRFMIQKSGRFEYDPNLDGFYDYKGYGLQRMEQESGMFTDRGYVSYHGTLSMDELMAEDPAQQFQAKEGFQIGGIQ